MPIYSMTGFGRSVADVANQQIIWEIKSVNARGLELRFKLPAGLDDLEPDLRKIIRNAIGRGSCQIGLRMTAAVDRPSLRLNEGALALAVAAAKRLADVDGIAPPTADGILAIKGVLEEADVFQTEIAKDDQRDALMGGFGVALDALVAARKEEGLRLQSLVDGQIEFLDGLVQRADEIAKENLPATVKRIDEQIEALKSERDLDADRLHQEAVMIALKSDIREEIDRLGGHIQSVRDCLAEGSPVGRRLDFLAQEMNREANTLCSKAWDRELVDLGVDLKTGIDQFREQVQNLE